MMKKKKRKPSPSGKKEKKRKKESASERISALAATATSTKAKTRTKYVVCLRCEAATPASAFRANMPCGRCGKPIARPRPLAPPAPPPPPHTNVAGPRCGTWESLKTTPFGWEGERNTAVLEPLGKPQADRLLVRARKAVAAGQWPTELDELSKAEAGSVVEAVKWLVGAGAGTTLLLVGPTQRQVAAFLLRGVCKVNGVAWPPPGLRRLRAPARLPRWAPALAAARAAPVDVLAELGRGPPPVHSERARNELGARRLSALMLCSSRLPSCSERRLVADLSSSAAFNRAAFYAKHRMVVLGNFGGVSHAQLRALWDAMARLAAVRPHLVGESRAAPPREEACPPPLLDLAERRRVLEAARNGQPDGQPMGQAADALVTPAVRAHIAQLRWRTGLPWVKFWKAVAPQHGRLSALKMRYSAGTAEMAVVRRALAAEGRPPLEAAVLPAVPAAPFAVRVLRDFLSEPPRYTERDVVVSRTEAARINKLINRICESLGVHSSDASKVLTGERRLWRQGAANSIGHYHTPGGVQYTASWLVTMNLHAYLEERGAV